MATTIEELLEEIRVTARREQIPVDVPVYERFKKDPLQPILYAGTLTAPVCIFGRDLGKDEVRLGQPLIGAGGSLVRKGLVQAWESHDSGDGPSHPDLEATLRHALLTNTVPYKPPGNKAYSDANQGAIPATDPRADYPVLERPSHHSPGDRGVPLVRALWGRSRVSIARSHGCPF